MPRSTYVYVASTLSTELPEATFTVKHEAISWILKQDNRGAFSLYRYRDGGPSSTYGYDTFWTFTELMEAA